MARAGQSEGRTLRRALPPLTGEAPSMQEQQDAAPAVLDAMRDAAGYVSSDIQDAVAEERSLAAAGPPEGVPKDEKQDEEAVLVVKQCGSHQLS